MATKLHNLFIQLPYINTFINLILVCHAYKNCMKNRETLFATKAYFKIDTLS